MARNYIMSSDSSVYATDGEDEMDIQLQSDISAGAGLRKRKIEVEDESTGIEGETEPAKIKRGEERVSRRLMERQEGEILQKRKRQSEERKKREMEEDQEIEMKAVEHQRKLRNKKIEKPKERDEEEEEEEEERRISNIQLQMKRIMEGIGRENGGKISVTRADQTAVREAVFELQNELIEMMKMKKRVDLKLIRLSSLPGRVPTR